jgi:hypothetical protein
MTGAGAPRSDSWSARRFALVDVNCPLATRCDARSTTLLDDRMMRNLGNLAHTNE